MAYTALDKARANLAKAEVKQRLAEIAAEGAADARKIAERKHAEEIAAAEDRYREAIRKAEKAALKAELDRITALDKAAKAESEIAALSPSPSIESAQATANEQREAAAEEISKEDTNTADDQKEIPAAVESEQEEESAQTAQGSDEDFLDSLDAESETDDPDQNAPAKFDFRLPSPENTIEGGDEFFDHLLDVAKDKDKLTDCL